MMKEEFNSGLFGTPFNDIYCNHVRDFNNDTYYAKTELSIYKSNFKRNNKQPNVQLFIKLMVIPSGIFFRFYLKKTLLIIKFPNQDILLNKSSEFISKWRHENKNLIMNLK